MGFIPIVQLVTMAASAGIFAPPAKAAWVKMGAMLELARLPRIKPEGRPRTVVRILPFITITIPITMKGMAGKSAKGNTMLPGINDKRYTIGIKIRPLVRVDCDRKIRRINTYVEVVPFNFTTPEPGIKGLADGDEALDKQPGNRGIKDHNRPGQYGCRQYCGPCFNTAQTFDQGEESHEKSHNHAQERRFAPKPNLSRSFSGFKSIRSIPSFLKTHWTRTAKGAP